MTALFIKLLALASLDLLQKQHFTPLGLYFDKTEAKMGGGLFFSIRLTEMMVLFLFLENRLGRG